MKMSARRCHLGWEQGGGNVPLILEIEDDDDEVDRIYCRPSYPKDKRSERERAAYTLNSRDYKGVMIVVLSEDNRSADGKQPSGELLRTGCIHRHVRDGEEE